MTFTHKHPPIAKPDKMLFLCRWDIEVNFRDEKAILGIGQAYVPSESSSRKDLAKAVAA
jgi:hypothetical protein